MHQWFLKFTKGDMNFKDEENGKCPGDVNEQLKKLIEENGLEFEYLAFIFYEHLMKKEKLKKQ